MWARLWPLRLRHSLDQGQHPSQGQGNAHKQGQGP